MTQEQIEAVVTRWLGIAGKAELEGKPGRARLAFRKAMANDALTANGKVDDLYDHYTITR
tara:strand:- start:147 stop:326 length:180 start_codon:yes stop_codon:yes gene_type:complete